MSKTIAIDFDGVIHNYERWGPVIGKPIDGAFDCIRTLITKHPIYVFCARDEYAMEGVGLNAIPQWFERHELGIPTYLNVAHNGFWEDKSKILITNRKIPASVYIDDRGLHFQNWPQTMKELVTRL